ncbi:hypothetical protein BX667DRAFT_342762 [Coemansia mojavensis]|nr:hypothetical protein BX667DRAFT_342762 [Coemansia mojavensis]
MNYGHKPYTCKWPSLKQYSIHLLMIKPANVTVLLSKYSRIALDVGCGKKYSLCSRYSQVTLATSSTFLGIPEAVMGSKDSWLQDFWKSLKAFPTHLMGTNEFNRHRVRHFAVGKINEHVHSLFVNVINGMTDMFYIYAMHSSLLFYHGCLPLQYFARLPSDNNKHKSRVFSFHKRVEYI